MMKLSEKRLAANRQNSKLSTGPISSEGKAKVSQNAVKHRLFQKALFVNSDNLEEQEEYSLVFYGLFKDWQPQGTTETITVQVLAIDYVRLNRLYRYETAQLEEKREESLPPHYSSLVEDLRGLDKVARVLRNFDSDPVAACNCFLEQHNPGDGKESAIKLYWAKTLDNFERVCPDEKEKFRQCVFQLAVHIDSKIKEKRRLKEELDRVACIISFPSEQEANKITKYKAALERSKSRHLEELIALQKLRGKEFFQ